MNKKWQVAIKIFLIAIITWNLWHLKTMSRETMQYLLTVWGIATILLTALGTVNIVRNK